MTDAMGAKWDNENNTGNSKDDAITAALHLKIQVLAEALKCFSLLFIFGMPGLRLLLLPKII